MNKFGVGLHHEQRHDHSRFLRKLLCDRRTRRKIKGIIADWRYDEHADASLIAVRQIVDIDG